MARRTSFEATVSVRDYTKLMRLISQADRKSARAMRDIVRQAGDETRREAAQRFSPISQRSAAGYRVVVRQRGVDVEQALPRTTGRHPEWGTLQMERALIPALNSARPRTVQRMEQALERLAAEFNRK